MLLLVTALAGSLAAQTFRTDVYTVTVTVTVTDRNNRLVTGLTRADFDVFEDGAVQRVTQFTDQRVPISLGVLLDTSDSMRGQAIVDARLAVNRFIERLLDESDETFVATFNHTPRLATTWTRPPALPAASLARVSPSGGTAIYDALIAASRLFKRRINTRAAMVVVSDGADTASERTLAQAREAIRHSDAFVYAVAIDAPDGRDSTRVNPDALRDVTGPSGGYTEIVRSAAEVGPATERIADELNHQYTIGYTPARAPDGTWRAIRVRVRAAGATARARRGYYAERGQP